MFPVNYDLNSLRELPHSFELENQLPVRNKLSSLTVSDPIVVSGNNDFDLKASTYGWSGNGTSSNPYIIENLSIINNTGSTYGISISTTRYFVIRNNYIEMTGVGSSGIYFSSVNNVGTIYNNTLFNNTLYSIYLSSSNGNKILNNIITNCQDTGIYLSGSDSNIIEFNSLTENTGITGAMKLQNTNNNKISHNNISYNRYGISHSSFNEYNTYYNNTFSNNTDYGIISFSFFDYNNFSENRFLSNNYAFSFNSFTDNNLFSNNYFENNTYGIRFNSGSNNNTIYDNFFVRNNEGLSSNVGESWVFNNTFLENTRAINIINGRYGVYQNNTIIKNGYGIYVNSGVNNTFFDNNFINNSNGIYFSSSNYNNTFYGNNFLHNVVQGYFLSSTGTNYADNGTFGNFWLDHLGIDNDSDGILDTPYALDGFGGVDDNFPLSIWNNETFNPEIINSPTNLTYETHSLGHNLTWRALDESPLAYEVFFNSSSQGTNTFTSREFFNVSVDGFDLGETNVTITFRDTDMNIASKTVFVKVIDTVQPNITLLSNVSFQEGSSDSFLNWSFIDFHPYNYSLYIDDELNKTGLWNNSNPVSVNVSHLLKGFYNYTMLVQDTSSNYNRSVQIVNIYDGTPPIISQPSNVTYEHGVTGQNITWVAWDNYPSNYSIFREGVLVDSGNWTSGGNILVSVDGLSPGTYKYVIIVQDESSWINSTTVYVNVTQSLSYYIGRLSDVSILEGFGNLTLSWQVFSNDTGFYTIYQDLVNSSFGSWMNNQTINYTISSLPIGIYNITISLNNSLGEIIIDTVILTVDIDTIKPIVSDEADQFFLEYSTNQTIHWTFFDNNPSTYQLLVNNSLLKNETWPANNSLTVLLDGLGPGWYNYTLLLYDIRGNSQYDTVLVFVIDNTAPTISNFPPGLNVTIEYGQPFNLSWQAYDYSPFNYTIYVDHSVFVTEIWINNSIVDFSPSNLDVGEHNITIIFRDLFGQTASHQLLVIVEDTKPPVLSSPDDISFTVNNLGPFEINWSISDDFNGTYNILRNGVNIQSGSWNASEYITIEVTFLDAGSYNFTLVVIDFSGNMNSDMVSVDVLTDNTTQPPVSSHVSTTTTSRTSTSDQTSATLRTTSVQFWVLLIGIAVLVVRKGNQSKKLK
jgi:parallel beta-helix repeat protein